MFFFTFTEKVSTMKLPLPDGVEVVHAVSAVGHLSSSSIYPACLAPYVIVTACSGMSLVVSNLSKLLIKNYTARRCSTFFPFTDRTVRFWRTRLVTNEPMNPKHQFEWEEWHMESADGNSSIGMSKF